jgi:hypothetical protein
MTMNEGPTMVVGATPARAGVADMDVPFGTAGACSGVAAVHDFGAAPATCARNAAWSGIVPTT